jgi:Ca-activated chloride channel family protein
MALRTHFVVTLALAIAMPLGSAAEACTLSSRAVLLLLDASYSMLNRVAGGTTRFGSARNSISAVVDLLPNDGMVALRFYGSQTPAQRQDCMDSVLAVPFAPVAVNRAPIALALATAHARGVTPIAYSLTEAVKDFLPNKDLERTIILVSDGGESCEGNPCAIAAAMHAEGFVINTVGFMIAGLARAQLRCIAANSGGEYFDVSVAATLSDNLRQAFGECPIATAPPPGRRTDEDVMTS